MARGEKNTALVLNRGYDKNLNYNQKLWAARILGIFSLIIMFCYSTPNTMYVGKLIGQNTVIDLGWIVIPGAIILQIIGAGINILEYGFLLMYVWKKDWYYLVGLAACMFASISGSFIFQETGQQKVKMTQNEINTYRNMATSYDDIIDQKAAAIEAAQTNLKALERQEVDTRQKTYSYDLSISEKANRDLIWILKRLREAREEIARLSRESSALSDSLAKYNITSIKKADQAGYMVSFGENSKKISLGLSLFLEILAVSLGYFYLILYDSVVQDKLKNYKHQRITETETNHIRQTKKKKRFKIFGGLKPLLEGTPGGTPVYSKNEISKVHSGVNVYRTPEGTPESENDGNGKLKNVDLRTEFTGQIGTPVDISWSHLFGDNGISMDLAIQYAKEYNCTDPVIVNLKLQNSSWGYERIGKAVGDLMNVRAISKTYVKRVLSREGLKQLI